MRGEDVGAYGRRPVSGRSGRIYGLRRLTLILLMFSATRDALVYVLLCTCASPARFPLWNLSGCVNSQQPSRLDTALAAPLRSQGAPWGRMSVRLQKCALGFIVASLLAACQHAPPAPTRAQLFDAAAKRCIEAHTGPVQTAQCMNTAEDAAYAGDGLADLHRVRTTERLMLATKVERHEMSPEEAAAEFAKTDAAVHSQAETRAYHSDAVAAQAAQAYVMQQQAQRANNARAMCQLSGQCW